MDNNSLLVEATNGVGVLTLNRPAVHNALNGALLQALSSAVTQLGNSGDVRTIIITGTGERAFSAGADLDELAGLGAVEAQQVLSAGQQALAVIESSTVPIIAAVNGLALGGGFELILACTFPVLSTNASFGLPETGLGLIPGYGGTQRLTKAVGKSQAAYLMLTGTRMKAQRAFELGLTPVEPVEPNSLLSAAMKVAEQMASKGPRANASVLQAVGTDRPGTTALELETALAAIAVSGSEAEEGIAAFKERRQAGFGPLIKEATP